MLRNWNFIIRWKGASHFVHEANYVAPSPPRGLGSDPLSFEYKKGLAFS